MLLLFAYGPQVGDLVGHPERATRSVSIGRISSDYRFTAPDLHSRDVTWLVRRTPRGQFSDRARQELSARVAFFAVRGSADEILTMVAPR